ncbi:MAG: hypothetical protein U0599_25965 [Vicinamibacteria bacterium]
MRPILPVSVLALTVACSGASAPPPPVATPTPQAASADGTQPLSSREAAPAPGAAAQPGAMGQPGAAASLPPGHPPLEGGGAMPALPPGHAPIGGGAPGAVKSAGSIAGTIKLAPSLKAGATDILYVMAKSGASTLAVKRIEKPAFPLAFEIGGADAMMGGQAFEGPVDVVARLSRTGDAIPSKGDAEGTTKGVKIPAKGVTVTIDSVRQ